MIHREFKDFRVLMESVDVGIPEHTVLGTGGAIEPGHVIETRYRGAPERWRVRSISHEDTGEAVWCATVLPVPALRLVA